MPKLPAIFRKTKMPEILGIYGIYKGNFGNSAPFWINLARLSEFVAMWPYKHGSIWPKNIFWEHLKVRRMLFEGKTINKLNS